MMIQTLIIVLYLLGWTAFGAGYILVKSGSTSGNRLARVIWNSRIDKLNRKPFIQLINSFEQRAFFPTALWIFLVNGMMVIIQFLLGLVLLSPLLVIIQGFLMGAIVVHGERKTQWFAMFTLIFELGAFTTAAAIGLGAGMAWILNNEQLFYAIHSLRGYFYLPVTLLFLNAVFEASGMFLGIESIPRMDAVKYRLYR